VEPIDRVVARPRSEVSRRFEIAQEQCALEYVDDIIGRAALAFAADD
jgi:hypothetical protein